MWKYRLAKYLYEYTRKVSVELLVSQIIFRVYLLLAKTHGSSSAGREVFVAHKTMYICMYVTPHGHIGRGLCERECSP